MSDDSEPRGHLRRLDRVFPRTVIYFVTTNVTGRRRLLDTPPMQSICEEVWNHVSSLHHWSIGSYVIMPDHVHFFCRPAAEETADLSRFVGKWKEWTSKYVHRRLGFAPPLWQREFFDHLIRSNESLREKLEYVRQNPVRAGLVDDPDDWPYRGNLGDWGVYQR